MEPRLRYFSMYIGIAEITSPNIKGKFENIRYSSLDGWLFNGEFADQCQLILKPLTELTNEDTKKISVIDDHNIWSFVIHSNKEIYKHTNTLAYERIESLDLEEWFELVKLGYAIPVDGLYDPFELEFATIK